MSNKIRHCYYGTHADVAGYIECVIHSDYIYCEMIEVKREYRGKGIATTLVDEVMEKYDLPLVYTLTSKNSTGAKFWKKYTKDKWIRNIKGLTYRIERE